MTEDRRVKLLLVDDRPENLLALQAILEPLGQTLVLAHSGEEALKCVLQHVVEACALERLRRSEIGALHFREAVRRASEHASA